MSMESYKGYTKDWATKELAIPIDVMVHEYRLAKNKEEQIDILADQCGTKTCRIAWILDRCGLNVNPKKKPRALRNEGSFDYVAHWQNSADAVACDRIREQMQELAEEAVEKLKETVEKEPEMVEMWMEGNETETVPAEAEPEAAAEAETAEAETERPEKWKDPADLRREILADAAVCVCSDRNRMYGEPEDNFDVIAGFWETYLGMPVSGRMVADMMILFKVARIATAEKPSRDSYVDIAGYAACGGGMIK